jgi:adenylate cyclase
MKKLLLAFFLLLIFNLFTGIESTSANNSMHPDTLILRKKYEDAINILRDSLKVLSTSREAHRGVIEDYHAKIALCYFRLSNYTAAIEWFHNLLEIHREKGDLEAIASTLNNIGLCYKMRGNFDKAIEYYERTVGIDEELGKGLEIAKTLNNIGMAYKDWGRYDQAIEYMERSLLIRNNLNDKIGVSKTLNNIGLIYSDWQNYEQAIVNFRESLRIVEEIGEKDEMAIRLNNLGFVYYSRNQNETALFYFMRALEIYQQTNKQDQIALAYNNIGKVYLAQKKYDQAIAYIYPSLNIYKDLDRKPEKATVLANLGDIYRILGKTTQALQMLDSSTMIVNELNLRKQLQQNYLYYSEIYNDMQNYQESLDYFRKYSQLKDSIFSDEIIQQLSDFQIKYETEKKENEIQILRQNEEIQTLALKKQKTFRNSMLAVSLLLLTIAVIIYTGLQRKKRDNLIIASAMEKSDQLLLNILPSSIASDLKEMGRTDPKHFTNVSVCFLDIVDFTKKAALLDPGVLIDELNQIYTAFDNIIESCTCERIKTIGDSYMAVSGLPEPDTQHAEHIILACIEMIRFLRKRNANSSLKWEVRVGVHSGDVVAGVVGVKKFIYDVFGDTINLASRLENNSEPMRINISEATYNLIKDEFEAQDRGEIEAKNMGRVRMYFVTA